MKKIRCCPFGYKMVHGRYVVVPGEQELVQRLFDGYLEGMSFSQLVCVANSSGLMFRENSTGWNKNMIARVLCDQRYWDQTEFPPIIMQEQEEQVRVMRERKTQVSSQTAVVRRFLQCGRCGAPIHRDSRKLPKVYWSCKQCGMRAGPLTDAELMAAIESKFSEIVQAPQKIIQKTSPANSMSMQAMRLGNQINQVLNQRSVDQSQTLDLILQCAEEKYKACSITESDHVTANLLSFVYEQKSDGLLKLDSLQQIVKKIVVQSNGTISFQMLNGKIV